jgi:hypothetical protein
MRSRKQFIMHGDPRYCRTEMIISSVYLCGIGQEWPSSAHHVVLHWQNVLCKSRLQAIQHHERTSTRGDGTDVNSPACPARISCRITGQPTKECT